jgi:hypothetical protein
MTCAETPPAEQLPASMTIPAEYLPNEGALVTEYDALLTNLFCAKQQRLLVESLYSSWAGPGEGRPFLVEANLGVFYSVHRPPLVPSVVLCLDAQAPADLWAKAKHAYFMWENGRPPHMVIEIVTRRQSPQGEEKLPNYAWIGVPFSIVFDPTGQLGAEPLRMYVRVAREYQRYSDAWFPRLGLGLRLWQGEYEGLTQTWLRWTDQAGNVIPTGVEAATRERQRAERLAAQLRDLGVEP